MSQQDPTNREDVLSKYRAAPGELAAALTNVTPDQLEAEAHPGGWTIRELVHHITDGDDLWKACILAGLGEATPEFTLQWYWSLPQDKWSQWWLYGDRAVGDSLDMFRANRSIVAATLSRTTNWPARTVKIRSRDGTLKTETLLEVVRSQADHAMQHIEEIKQALAESREDDGRAA